jgi:hypothetical protein
LNAACRTAPESYGAVRHTLKGAVLAVLSNTSAQMLSLQIVPWAMVLSDVAATDPADWARVNWRLKGSGRSSLGQQVEKQSLAPGRTVIAGVGALAGIRSQSGNQSVPCP